LSATPTPRGGLLEALVKTVRPLGPTANPHFCPLVEQPDDGDIYRQEFGSQVAAIRPRVLSLLANRPRVLSLLLAARPDGDDDGLTESLPVRPVYRLHVLSLFLAARLDGSTGSHPMLQLGTASRFSKGGYQPACSLLLPGADLPSPPHLPHKGMATALRVTIFDISVLGTMFREDQFWTQCLGRLD